jgi:hypothetical protein
MFNSLNLRSNRFPSRSEEWPKGAFETSKFGQKVLWWSKDHGGHHMCEEELDPYRQIGDPEVDRILGLLEDEGSPLGAGDDFVLLAEQAFKLDPASRSPAQKELADFFKAYSTLPSWVDVDQLRRGQEVFLTYTPAALYALYYRSLIGGFSIPKIAAVIRRTGYLAPPSRPPQVMQRLLDTGELINACMSLGVEALLPNGTGYRTVLHVRALHAKVRKSLLGQTGKSTWKTERFGVPINQEDMAATLLGFSVNTLNGIEIAAGLPISKQERLDYLALWRYIGFLLGVDTAGMRDDTDTLPPLDPCGPGNGHRPDPLLHSNSLLESIIFHILDPDETSCEIAHHLLQAPSAGTDEKATKDSTIKSEIFYFRSLQCRRLIGDPLADALSLELHPRRATRLKLFVKSTIYLVLLRIYTLTAMWIPPLRRRMIRFHKNSMAKVHDNWIKTHQSKMARALQRRELASIHVDGNEELVEKSDSPCCPFAMVAEPR